MRGRIAFYRAELRERGGCLGGGIPYWVMWSNHGGEEVCSLVGGLARASRVKKDGAIEGCSGRRAVRGDGRGRAGHSLIFDRPAGTSQFLFEDYHLRNHPGILDIPSPCSKQGYCISSGLNRNAKAKFSQNFTCIQVAGSVSLTFRCLSPVQL